MHFSLSDMVLDLLQNSVEAGSSLINMDILQSSEGLGVCLQDNGKGMSKEELERAKDPFYSDGNKHKERRVGLGLPFLIQTVEQTDGRFEILSEKNRGTRLNIWFNSQHLDTPPEGDWPGLFLQGFCFDGTYELIISRKIKTRDNQEEGYILQRTELQDVLGDFTDSAALLLLRDYIRSQEEDLLAKKMIS